MMDFTSFGKLPRVPIESGVKRWQNMVKGCIMRVDRIEEIPQEKFTGHIFQSAAAAEAARRQPDARRDLQKGQDSKPLTTEQEWAQIDP